VKLVEEPEDDLDTLAALRGISRNVLEQAGIRKENDGRYSIPYPHRSGQWKTRHYDPNSQPKYRDDPGAVFHLYNPLKLGPGEEEVWFAEGEFDTLALIDQGLAAIGIHGVGNVKKDRAEEEKDSEEEDDGKRGFRRTWQLLFADTLCIVMFDNDDKGRPAGRRLARGLEGEVFDGWGDYKDANEWHRADATGLGAAIDRFRAGAYRSKGMVPGEPLVE